MFFSEAWKMNSLFLLHIGWQLISIIYLLLFGQIRVKLFRKTNYEFFYTVFILENNKLVSVIMLQSFSVVGIAENMVAQFVDVFTVDKRIIFFSFQVCLSLLIFPQNWGGIALKLQSCVDCKFFQFTWFHLSFARKSLKITLHLFFMHVCVTHSD